MLETISTFELAISKYLADSLVVNFLTETDLITYHNLLLV